MQKFLLLISAVLAVSSCREPAPGNSADGGLEEDADSGVDENLDGSVEGIVDGGFDAGIDDELDGGADGGDNTQPGTDWPLASATASSELSPAANAIDGDLGTRWRSDSHAKAQNNEWIRVIFDGPHLTNRIRLAIAVVDGGAVGFPVEISTRWLDGTTWREGRGFTHVARPGTQWATFFLPDTVNASGVEVASSVLGANSSGGYQFELTEVSAGYNENREPLRRRPTSVQASSSLWPAEAAIDGDAGTSWSSATHATAANSESLAYWWPGLKKVNYIKLLPRYGGNTALGFPSGFTIYYSTGSAWVAAMTHANFPRPYRGEPIILPLKGTVLANGIQLVANSLGDDTAGNFVFQLAEAEAGYDVGFDGFAFLDNDGNALRNEVRNVGSETINRKSQLAHWDFDARGALVVPNPGPLRNLYAPSIVHGGGSKWNIFFGGWDGVAVGHDELYRTTTDDDFLSFGSHAKVISKGVFEHVNNDCTVQVAPNDWRMAYTCLTVNGGLNRPCYATSTDGIAWTPSAGSASHVFNMTGYAGWSAADLNGVNVIYREDGGTWHYFFKDQTNPTRHATSTDFVNYTYQGEVVSDAYAINDLKAFSYGGSTYYLGGYHYNGTSIWKTVSEQLDSFPAPTVAFNFAGASDRYIVGVGWVQDGARLYGALYGAGASTSLSENRIFAQWLQKKVIFENAHVRWGDSEQAFGPNRVWVIQASGQSVETGRFSIYDSDGTTLLYRSPLVTMREGDVWKYVP